MRPVLLIFCALCLLSCGDEKKPVPAVTVALPPKVAIKDESSRFPKKDLVEVKQVDGNLMGKSFLGGGNLGHYKRGKLEFDLFLAKSTGAEAAALVMFDYKKTLTNAKLIPHFGGYFGKDSDKDVFVFAKGPWIAGISGLPEKEADAFAREFAARISY